MKQRRTSIAAYVGMGKVVLIWRCWGILTLGGLKFILCIIETANKAEI